MTDETILTGGAEDDAANTDENSTDDVTDTGTSEGDNTDEDSASSECAADSNGDDTTPETYADFTLPEGVELDQVALETYTPLMKELGLSQEQAQKLVDLRAEEIQAGVQSQGEAFTQLIDGWKEESLSDKEFGGDNFKENVGIAHAAIEKFGTPELKKLMDDHGVGNHPEMIRFMWKVGKLVKEDVPGSTGGLPSKEQDAVSILYPNS